jgi:hypothetical protein
MEKLEELMEEHQFPPELIFNMDETMVDASGHRVKVITRAKGKRPTTANEKKFEHITFGLCISAAGGFVRPLCILPLKTLPPLCAKVRQFFNISGQENGFISNEIWHEWVEKVFIPFVNRIRQELGYPDQKVLLIVDSHVTRAHQPTIDLFEANNILVFIIPAHSSTILQPLDLAPNKELKRNLRLNFVPKKDEDRVVKRNRLLYTSVLCLQASLTGLQISLGFARAGIWPFSKEAPLNSNLIRNPLAELEYQPPKKRTRGQRIAGTILTNGQPTPLPLPPSRPPLPALPTPTPTNVPPQQLYCHDKSIVPKNVTINSFVNM